MSRRVTAAYAEESMVARFDIGAEATIFDLKRRACSELAKTAQQNYGFMNGFPSGDTASVVLSSGSHGQLDFEPSTRVSLLCGANEVIVATVPAPPKDSNVAASNTISSPLASPIHSHLHSLLQSHANTITADLLLRFDEVVKVERKEREEELKAALKVEREKREEELKVALKVEREKREEELKAALKVEREKREEELKAEREKREEALKAERERLEKALKAEREKREEALKAERKKWEGALKVEKEQRESEMVDASHKYEFLRKHLLEVEETTLDTVGWITNNDTKLLDRIKLRHLLTSAQEKLAIATGITDSNHGASLAWREALGPSEDLSSRLAAARNLLCRPGIVLDQRTQMFIASPQGLRLVVEAKSSIRWRGDKVAHPDVVTRAHFEGPVSRNVSLDMSGLQALVDFVCL